MRGCEVVIKCLEIHGVEYIFGLLGTTILPLVDGLKVLQDRGETKVCFMTTRHEQVAASMADGYIRVARRPAVFAAHAGAGLLNATLSIASAYKDSIPVVVIAGCVKQNLLGKESMYSVDQEKVFASISKGTFKSMSAKDIPEVIAMAFKTALSGCPGPVIIEIPENMYLEDIEFDASKYAPMTFPAPVPVKSDQIEKSINLLLSAKKPVLLVGGGAIWSGTVGLTQIRELSKIYSIPIVTTGMGMGILPDTDDLAMGLCGYFGGREYADFAISNADVILALGATFSDITTYEFNMKIPGKIIEVNIDPTVIGKEVPVEVGIAADVAVFLTPFLALLQQRRNEWNVENNAGWLNTLIKKKRLWWSDRARYLNSTAIPINAYRLVHDLGEVVPKNAIFVYGAGYNPLFLMQGLQVQDVNRIHGPANFGAMAVGFGLALGAKVANPDIPVVCCLGDGDFFMTFHDVDTAARLHLNIITVVFNNKAFGILRAMQKFVYNNRVCEVEFPTTPDFAQLAKVLGVHGIRLEDPAKIASVLKEALEKSKSQPVVIDAIIDVNISPVTNATLTAKMRFR